MSGITFNQHILLEIFYNLNMYILKHIQQAKLIWYLYTLQIQILARSLFPCLTGAKL